MKMTALEALNLAAAGKWNEAWHVAQQDEGLKPNTTFETWKKWSVETLSRRAGHNDPLTCRFLVE